VPVQGADADTGVLRDPVQGDVRLLGRERPYRGFEQPVAVAPRVRAQGPGVGGGHGLFLVDAVLIGTLMEKPQVEMPPVDMVPVVSRRPPIVSRRPVR
jgi:hypothetical protein